MTLTTGRHTPRGYEPGVRSVRGILVFAAILVLTLVAVDVAVWGLLRVFRGGAPEVPSPVPSTLSEFSSVQNWPDPPGDLARTRRREDEHLLGYGWIDRDHGVVRIPITRAMELLAAPGGGRNGPGTPP
ncbi:MAG: hypothetical protein IT437_10195 [Phycisphaerales bacterium]|nr:hypothetical protein [Phycisphaerales bacterium]